MLCFGAYDVIPVVWGGRGEISLPSVQFLYDVELIIIAHTLAGYM
jgi:hypothetical protein